MRLAKILYAFITLVVLSLLAGVIWFISTNYTSFINFAVDQLQRPDLRSKLESNFFTLAKYNTLKQMAYAGIGVLILLLLLFFIKRKKIIGELTALSNSIKTHARSFVQEFKRNERNTILILFAILILIAIRSVYYALHFYPQYDECWNYNYFLSNQFFTSIFTYNNYPLHNIITYAGLSILPDNTFCMRLPNIILGLLNCVFVFVFVKHLTKNQWVALAAVSLFSVLPVVVFYMLFARGVMLAMTFSLLLLFFFFIKKIRIWSTMDCILVGIIGALGCYSMISLPFFIMVLWLVFLTHTIVTKRNKETKSLLLSGTVLATATLLLYLPMLIGSGIGIGTASHYINANNSLATMQLFVAKVSGNQIGFNYGSYLFIALNVILLFTAKHKKFVVLNLSLLILPMILISCLGINLPARALSFQFIAYLSTLILLIMIINDKVPTIVWGTLVLGLSIFINYISVNHTFFDWSNRPDKGAFEIAQVMQAINITSYYDFDGNFSYYSPGILYHHKIIGKNITAYTSNKNSTRYLPIEQYTGDVFVADFAYRREKEIKETLYHYQDESNQFILFRSSPSLLNEAP